MVDAATKAMLEQGLFRADSFEALWMELKQEYESLGFRDEITDAEMIAEFKYITQQLRKYMFSKQDLILGRDTYEEMLAEVEQLIGKAPEYGDTRREIVYNFMRDHWLYGLYNVLSRLVHPEEFEAYGDDANEEVE